MTGWKRLTRMACLVIGWAVLVMPATGCLSVLNRYQDRGALHLPGLTAPVTVQRDEKGMAFIRADTLDDLLMAQGFVTAQDRLFQMHLIRRVIQGRISELAGKKTLDQDVRMRTIGLDRLAHQQAAILNPETRARFQRYVDGINAFIDLTPEDRHLEFRLARISPEKWDIADSLSLLYYLGYATAANLDTERIIQMLLDTAGYDRTCQILPLNIHPNDPDDTGEWTDIPCPDQLVMLKQKVRHDSDSARLDTGDRARPVPALSDMSVSRITGYLPDRYLRAGSNNWAVSPARSATGKALLCGDTHLDPRILPGPWYPVGLIAPGVRAVGVNIPGVPGMAMGRTDHIALAMTNSYADIQDLFPVRPDPDHPGHYLDNGKSHAFTTRVETVKIKDPDAPGRVSIHEFVVRATKKGPVVTDVFDSLTPHGPVSLRFAPAESMGPEIGLIDILTAKTSLELKHALTHLTMVCLNWVFADDQGRIGFQVSGRVPIRKQGYGTFLRTGNGKPPYSGISPSQSENGQPPSQASASDPWQGWIPVHEMPGTLDPPDGWIGTCNHKTVASDYPYYYSSYFAPRYRYLRLAELMSSSGPKTPDQMWEYQRDVVNPMARTIAPIMARALMQDPDTRSMGEILEHWDFQDDPDAAAPAIFQTVYLFFARAVFEDELGQDNTDLLLNTWYFWQERLQHMLVDGRSDWFDDVQTPARTETPSDLFVRAGRQARTCLTDRLGPDMDQWAWGRIHTLSLHSPVARDGWMARVLGTGPMPMGGSGETLYRGWYDADDPFAVTHCAALRMVVDFADPDKFRAVLPGGVTGRLFHPHHKDRVAPFMSGEPEYWWFSDPAIETHSISTLVLNPGEKKNFK
ncbi:MAG: penicillin acylase family protein [Desulfotignum sp.]